MQIVVRDAQVGVRHCSTYSLSFSVHTIKRVISPGCSGDMLVKLGQNVCQFNMIKIARRKKKPLGACSVVQRYGHVDR